MEKQRLFKMSALERDILAKVLDDTKKDFQPAQAEKMRALRDKTRQAPKCRLYLDDGEFDCAVQALNAIRSEFLSAGKSSTCFDRVLLMLLNCRYRRVPAQYR